MGLGDFHRHNGSDQPKLIPKDSFEGFQVLDAVPTYSGMQGEMVLYDNGTDTRALYTFLNGVWYSNSLT